MDDSEDDAMRRCRWKEGGVAALHTRLAEGRQGVEWYKYVSRLLDCYVVQKGSYFAYSSVMTAVGEEKGRLNQLTDQSKSRVLVPKETGMP